MITETSRRQVSEQRRGALAVQTEWPHVFQKPWAIPDVRRGHPGAWSCVPARSRRADGQRHQSSAPAHAGARGSSPALASSPHTERLRDRRGHEAWPPTATGSGAGDA